MCYSAKGTAECISWRLKVKKKCVTDFKMQLWRLQDLEHSTAESFMHFISCKWAVPFQTSSKVAGRDRIITWDRDKSYNAEYDQGRQFVLRKGTEPAKAFSAGLNSEFLPVFFSFHSSCLGRVVSGNACLCWSFYPFIVQIFGSKKSTLRLSQRHL